VRIDVEPLRRETTLRELCEANGIGVAQIELRARELPLPDVCLIVPSASEHPVPWNDRLTTLALLSKRKGSAWIRSQTPDLDATRSRDESFSVLVPPHFALRLGLAASDAEETPSK
jgi:hypothetical protein